MDYPFRVNEGLKGTDIKKAELECLSSTDDKYLAACKMEQKLKEYIEAFPDFPISYVDVEISWEDVEGV
jgi:hypothetical protein